MKIHKILTVFLVCVVLLCQTAAAQDKKPVKIRGSRDSLAWRKFGER